MCYLVEKCGLNKLRKTQDSLKKSKQTRILNFYWKNIFLKSISKFLHGINCEYIELANPR